MIHIYGVLLRQGKSICHRALKNHAEETRHGNPGATQHYPDTEPTSNKPTVERDRLKHSGVKDNIPNAVIHCV